MCWPFETECTARGTATVRARVRKERMLPGLANEVGECAISRRGGVAYRGTHRVHSDRRTTSGADRENNGFEAKNTWRDCRWAVGGVDDRLQHAAPHVAVSQQPRMSDARAGRAADAADVRGRGLCAQRGRRSTVQLRGRADRAGGGPVSGRGDARNSGARRVRENQSGSETVRLPKPRGLLVFRRVLSMRGWHAVLGDYRRRRHKRDVCSAAV